MKNANKIAINNLALNREIRYKWVIRIVVIIVCLAFWSIVDALEEPMLNEAYEEDVSVIGCGEVIFKRSYPKSDDCSFFSG